MKVKGKERELMDLCGEAIWIQLNLCKSEVRGLEGGSSLFKV